MMYGRRPYRSTKSIKLAGRTVGHTIKIEGRVLNILFAKIVYRCAICHCKLERRRVGLECLLDETHRGFVHRDDAKKIKAKVDEQTNEIEAAYEIVGGVIVAKEI